MRRHRGSALVMAILMILVLTVIGIGVAYLTQTEDRISGNDRLQRAGFYAAEAGLRAGERLISDSISQVPPTTFTTLIRGNGSSKTWLNPPGGGFQAAPLRTSVSGTLTDHQEQLLQAASGVNEKTRYSLYVRNNEEDATGGQNTDSDNAITLISVGEVVIVKDATVTPVTYTVLLTRMLEQKVLIPDVSLTTGSAPAQVGGGSGGTNAIAQ